MGTLSDITARATNTSKRKSSNPKGYRALESAQKENRASESPNFMSPTVASSRQYSGPTNYTNSNSPVPPQPVKAESKAWMKGAAKRVGVPRRTTHVGEGMPRSRKENLPTKQPKKAISFPDRVCQLNPHALRGRTDMCTSLPRRPKAVPQMSPHHRRYLLRTSHFQVLPLLCLILQVPRRNQRLLSMLPRGLCVARPQAPTDLKKMNGLCCVQRGQQAQAPYRT